MALPVGFGGGQPPKASEKNGEKQTARMSGRQVLTTSLDRRIEAMLARSNQAFKASSASSAAASRAASESRQLQGEFDSLLGSYARAIEYTMRCGARGQAIVDAAYAKLSEFTAKHESFKPKLPEKHRVDNVAALQANVYA